MGNENSTESSTDGEDLDDVGDMLQVNRGVIFFFCLHFDDIFMSLCCCALQVVPQDLEKEIGQLSFIFSNVPFTHATSQMQFIACSSS